MNTRLAFPLALALGFLAAAPCRADEALFGYVYTTDPLPKGHWEYEQWNTVRTGKTAGSYTSFDLRNEIEHGFTEDFTASLYLNSSYLHTKDVPDPDDATAFLRNRDAFDINGISVEMRYRLLNPYTQPVGLAIYMEPELGVRSKQGGQDEIERALELKVILQKNLLEDTLVLAANATMEPEWTREDGVHGKELTTDFVLGASWRAASHWALGVEASNRRNYENHALSKEEFSAYYLGPNIHYGAKTWWTTLTLLPRVGGRPREFGEHERLEVRLRLGVNF